MSVHDVGCVVGTRCGGGQGVVCCLLEVPEGCSCQVNILQCIPEGVPGIYFTRIDSRTSKVLR